ncbi:MAG: hypothetical protein ACP6IY_11040 [Promethearchaeia archaeon]
MQKRIISKNLSEKEGQILNILRESDMQRKEICNKLGWPRTTVYDNLYKLQIRGLVGKYTIKNGRGRPITIWRLL